MAADVTKKLTLKNGSSTQTKNIGAEAQYIDVGFDSNGDIIEDITETTPTTTESTAKVLKDIIADKAPKNHVSSTAEYGAASNSSFGHVKTGSTIDNNDGVINVKYGNTANTAAQGNDSRLSDDRKNPNAVTFSDGKATPTTKAYDGSSAETITYTDVGAAPQSHASSSTTYGVASKNNYGHVKIGTGISVNNGIISATGSGHIIENDEGQAMTSRPTLQFEGVNVVDDEDTEKTIIKPQFHVCATEAEWNQMSDAEKNDPLIYWVRPWASSDAFATDRTPVGTVVSVGAAKTGEATGVSTPTGRFPTDDYLVCDGSTYITVDNKTVYICQQNFPKLYDYFVEAYGTATYFGSGRGQQGDFSLPDWSADFPENGILCIKAQISSTAITYHEIDDTGIYAGEDKVPSCARVAEIESGLQDYQLIATTPANQTFSAQCTAIKSAWDNLTQTQKKYSALTYNPNFVNYSDGSVFPRTTIQGDGRVSLTVVDINKAQVRASMTYTSGETNYTNYDSVANDAPMSLYVLKLFV